MNGQTYSVISIPIFGMHRRKNVELSIRIVLQPGALACRAADIVPSSAKISLLCGVYSERICDEKTDPLILCVQCGPQHQTCRAAVSGSC